MSMTEATSPSTSPTYRKVEVDNAVCKRRFHIAFEDGIAPIAQVKIACPHCGVLVYEAKNHPPAILSREENLVKSPDGSNPVIYECKFPR